MLYSRATQLNAKKPAFFYFYFFGKKKGVGWLLDSFALKLYPWITHALPYWTHAVRMQLTRLYFTCCFICGFTCGFSNCVLL
jgi:hypothetical protein